MLTTGTSFLIYAVAPNSNGEYQLRRIHRTESGQLFRIERLDETFPMNAKGRKEAADTVSVLNRAMGRAA